MSASMTAFLAVATLLIIAPGPDSLLVTRYALRRGRTAGMVTTAGVMTGVALWALASALGLSRLVQASEVGYDALRIGGACYLVWLGVAALRSRHTSAPDLGGAKPAAGLPDAAGRPAARARFALARLYATGMLSNLLNPKIGVFFVAFLPAFIPAGAPVGATSALLGGLFVVETGLWLCLLSTLAQHGLGWLRRPAAQRLIDRVTGVVLIGFGIRLATEA
jgi:threonine/homoserine/homoserine lactone efflux protein